MKFKIRQKVNVLRPLNPDHPIEIGQIVGIYTIEHFAKLAQVDSAQYNKFVEMIGESWRERNPDWQDHPLYALNLELDAPLNMEAPFMIVPEAYLSSLDFNWSDLEQC